MIIHFCFQYTRMTVNVSTSGSLKKIIPMQGKNALRNMYSGFIVICVHNVKNYILNFKGAMKLYFMHYSWVVIILFNKSVFSTYSFEKLVFVCSESFVCSVLNSMWAFKTSYNICVIIIYIGTKWSLTLFSVKAIEKT